MFPVRLKVLKEKDACSSDEYNFPHTLFPNADLIFLLTIIIKYHTLKIINKII